MTGSETGSRPNTFTEPLCARSSPKTCLMSVVLPAPLAPTRPWTLPRVTDKLTDASAVLAPKRRVNSDTRTTGSLFIFASIPQAGMQGILALPRIRCPEQSSPEGVSGPREGSQTVPLKDGAMSKSPTAAQILLLVGLVALLGMGGALVAAHRHDGSSHPGTGIRSSRWSPSSRSAGAVSSTRAANPYPASRCRTSETTS